jgi:hypothetical protein
MFVLVFGVHFDLQWCIYHLSVGELELFCKHHGKLRAVRCT